MTQIDKNTLSNDLSPYLKQHKDNPVNWQTWSEDALKLAKQNSKPILFPMVLNNKGRWIGKIV